ncbi:MAG: hypothetical protein CL933_18340, partial [Deltaproteobacteria bacterium]|nr:hypothetical protein [Deltaproteobacteria bacterium]
MLQPLINAWARRFTQPCVAMLGIFVPQELSLPNAGFQYDLSGWAVTAPTGSVAHDTAPGAQAGCA